MPTDIKKLKNARGVLKGTLTRNYNALNDPESATPTTEEIETTIELMRSTFEFEKLYTSLNGKLRQLHKQQTPIITNPTEAGSQQQNIQRDLIPKINFVPLQTNETFRNFTNRLKVYLSMNRITDPKMKAYTLLSTIPPELHQRTHDLCSPEDPGNIEFDKLVSMLDDFVDPKPSVWASQHTFISRTQQADESIVTFASELKRLTSNCEFNCPNCKKPTIDTFLSLQLIRGIKDGDIRTKLLQEKDTLPFTRLVQRASLMECGKRENTHITNTIVNRTEPGEINKLSTKANNTKTTQFRPPTSIKELKGKCYRCGLESHRATECGAISSTCRKCQKQGHLARVCLQRNVNTHQLDESTSDVSDENIAHINLLRSGILPKYFVTIQIENKTVKMEFDTGAALASMSLSQFKSLNIPKKIFKTDMKFSTYTGEIIKAYGVAYVKCTYKDITFYDKLYIINADVDAMFGRSWIEKSQIELADVRKLGTSTQSPKLDDLLEEYATTARNYTTPGHKWEFGTVARRLGRLHYELQMDSGLTWTRHVDQLLPAPLVQP
ncbi:hypothetical protein NE865_05036 [Phthorimaea operculella]|nr:hypothetical protein NE865_05036 [Phthorimaea operculella]